MKIRSLTFAVVLAGLLGAAMIYRPDLVVVGSRGGRITLVLVFWITAYVFCAAVENWKREAAADVRRGFSVEPVRPPAEGFPPDKP